MAQRKMKPIKPPKPSHSRGRGRGWFGQSEKHRDARFKGIENRRLSYPGRPKKRR